MFVQKMRAYKVDEIDTLLDNYGNEPQYHVDNH